MLFNEQSSCCIKETVQIIFITNNFLEIYKINNPVMTLCCTYVGYKVHKVICFIK